MSNKTISIDPSLFSLTGSKTRKAKKTAKQSQPNNEPTTQKRVYSQKKRDNTPINFNTPLPTTNPTNDEFLESLEYIESHQSTNPIPPPTHQNIPYSNIKGGSKPSYREWSKTLKHHHKPSFIDNNTPSLLHNTPTHPHTIPIIKRNTHEQRTQAIKKAKRTITRKYNLGRSTKTKTINVLLKNNTMKKKVEEECLTMKSTPLIDVIKYLKAHNLIKIGTNAPEHVLRSLYENARLTGDVINIDKHTLLHNLSQPT